MGNGWRPAVAGWLLLGGCFPDDWNGQPYVPPTDGLPTITDDSGAPVVDGIVGSWVSEGSDRSPLFAAEPFDYASVVAEFGASGAYVVTSTDQEGVEYVLVGTYETTDDVPGAITLRQTDPYVATAEGLWAVDGDTLTYEVVQTIPDYGYSPPTPGDGFGSTSGPGMTPGLNVQTYRRR
jgi:hypothetical protein